MKLRLNYITQTIDGVLYLIPVGGGQFNGFVRINHTGAFIIECLKKETSENLIVEKMVEYYKVPKKQVEADVKETIGILRELNALEE